MRPKALNFLEQSCRHVEWSSGPPHRSKGKQTNGLSTVYSKGKRDGSVAENLNLVPGIHVRAHNHPHSVSYREFKPSFFVYRAHGAPTST